MMKRVVAGAMLAAAFAIAAPAGADSPMTPLRPLSSTKSAAQWVEPPPAPAESQAAIPPSATVAQPDAAASQPGGARRERSDRRSARAAGRSGGMASRLNRRELIRARSGGVPYYYAPYYGGYGHGPSPNGGSGD